jgi:hypothetical protein
VSRSATIAVSVEATPKKAFATAVDWPGWSRSGKTEELALAALQDYAPRYAVVAAQAGVPFEPGEYEIVERTGGAGGTDFGVPSSITDLDRRPVDAGEAKRVANLVEAAWAVFARVSAGAPAELRKGPRGGGRDRDKMVAHVIEAEWAYAREMGIKVKQPDPMDPAAIDLLRNAMLDVLRNPSDGSALAGRRWTARYAASRISWHVLDHTWELEDRAEPG